MTTTDGLYEQVVLYAVGVCTHSVGLSVLTGGLRIQWAS
jgi:hypothetical protein